MERYFRTKDGKIYDVNRYAYHWSTPKGVGLGISINESVFIAKNLIEKPADDLDELFDEYVLKATIDGRTEYLHDRRLAILKISKVAYESEGYSCEIYGAIWTTGEDGEPIFKSVAKMNSKGELELL